MKLIEIIREEEKEFNKFEVSEYITPDHDLFLISFKNGKESIGTIAGERYRQFYVIDNIYVFPDYQGRGYSKFMYKFALNLANEHGLEGLIVGKSLLTKDKSVSTYKNFENHEYSISNLPESRRIILTKWIWDKSK